MDAGLQAFAATPLSPTIQGRESYCVQSFIEGLFSFTFSKYCASFPEDDCRYFLEVANQQNSYSTLGTATVVAEDPHHHNFTAMNVFKLYLSRILDEAIQKPQVHYFTLGLSVLNLHAWPLPTFTEGRSYCQRPSCVRL